MKRVIPLQYGTAFKKGFSDPRVFTAFVKAVLGIDIEITTVETEKSFYPAVSPIGVRFDLFAEDTKNRLIIEIQHEHRPDHYDRFLYYHSTALVEMTRKSTNYRPPRTLYTIVVQTGTNASKEDVVTIDFDPVGRQKGKLNKLEHKIVFVCSKYIYHDTPPALREWLSALEDSLDYSINESTYTDPSIQHLFELIEEDNLTPDDRAHLIEDNYLEQALNDRENKTTQRIAIQMLRSGLSIEQIASMTGLTEETIQQLDTAPQE